MGRLKLQFGAWSQQTERYHCKMWVKNQSELYLVLYSILCTVEVTGKLNFIDGQSGMKKNKSTCLWRYFFMKLICCCNWSLGLKACRVRLYCRLQQGQWHCRTVFKVNILQPYCPHLHTEKLNRKIPFNFVCFPPHQKVTGWCFICIRLQFTWITLISIKCILKVRSVQWSIVQCYAVTLQLQLQF